MKHIIYDNSNNDVQIYIGNNQKENDEIIDLCDSEDFWIHAHDKPSCHVVILFPEKNNYCKKEILKIIKQGAVLCKSNTNSLKKDKNVKFCYTKIKNVIKTDILGKVEVSNLKFITI